MSKVAKVARLNDHRPLYLNLELFGMLRPQHWWHPTIGSATKVTSSTSALPLSTPLLPPAVAYITHHLNLLPSYPTST